MPSLRKCLRHPGTYLTFCALLVGLTLIDSCRPPSQQYSAYVYVWSVSVYQRTLSPALSGRVRCRYQPTCSRYSAESVFKFGIRKGINLTMRRLWRCRGDVSQNTYDPVPTD
jgi:uncharacterized protein